MIRGTQDRKFASRSFTSKNTRFYRNVINYVQLVLTAIAVLHAVFLVFKLLRNHVFPKLSFCCSYSKKDGKVKQYTVVPRLTGKSA